MRRGPADGEVGVFYVVMEGFPKPGCYDSVPPCLCKKCQRYDMYMASCVPRTFGKTMCGLAVVNAARSSYADVHSRSVRCKPSCSCSRPVAPPVMSSSVAVCSSTVSARPSSVAASTVVSRPAPFGSLARSVSSSPVLAVVSSCSSVSTSSFARSVSSSPVVSRSSSVTTPSSVVVSHPTTSGSLACSVPVSPVCPSPVVVASSKVSGVSSGPAGSGSTVSSSMRPVPVWPRCVPRFVRPRALLTVGPSTVPPFARPVFSAFVPVVCLVLVVVPVVLLSPFGLVWSFLPVWH